MILLVAPGYRTDALLRKVNVDRYDDRLIVETNLVESDDLLIGFAEKHPWDKFYLEDDRRMSLRNIIARETLVNTLIHREMTSSYIAKFVIEKDRMFVENANRAIHDGVLTPDDLNQIRRIRLSRHFLGILVCQINWGMVYGICLSMGNYILRIGVRKSD